MRFFIVDDDPFCRMLYHQHLSNLGYKNNVLFDNGIDCLNKLDLQPDVILLDFNMMPVNGLEVLQAIKRKNPGIYLLIISDQTDIEVKRNLIEEGAYEYISKGDRDLEMLSNTINKIKSQI